MQFLAALKKFEKENASAKAGEQPAGQQAAQPANGVQPEDKAAAAQLGQQPGEKAAAEGAQPGQAAPEAPPATPQALADLMQKTPEFGALLEQHPEVKGPIFAMARELAAAKPIAEMFPTLGDAQFAQQHAQELVGLKTLSMRAADRPETVPELLGAFDQQFQVVGADGKPVLDATGNPTYGADKTVFENALVSRQDRALLEKVNPQIEQLQQKLKTGVYPNEAARALDQKRLENLEYAQLALQVMEQVRSGEWFEQGVPEIPADATPEFKAWAEQERARLEDERKQLQQQKQGQTAEQRAQARTQFQSQVRGDMAGMVGKMIGERLKAELDAGVYIPEFVLQEMYRDPKTGQETKTSALAVRIFNQFESELTRPGSRDYLEISQHELLPENEQTRAIRREWYQKKAALRIPQLMQAEINRIQGYVKADQEKQQARQQARQQAAQPEPATGGSGLPQNASEQQMRTQAEEMAKKDPGYAAATPAEKQARIVTQYNRLRGGKK